jgi:cytochrome c peroxidase
MSVDPAVAETLAANPWMGGRRSLCLVSLLAALCTGCGGGGGGASSQATPVPVWQPPAANQAPRVIAANAPQSAMEGHPFTYDATQNGKTFSDPDGDPLTYSVTISYAYDDFHVQGTSIVGVPTHVGAAPNVTIEASDGRGGTIADTFQVSVLENSKPVVLRPNRVLLTQPGEHVNYDPTQGGAAFTDADGDPLSFTTVAVVAPSGLSVMGGRVVGALLSVGFAAFEITASDGYGGTVVDKFGVAVVGPEPGRPVLPATSYSYADSELPLPAEFRRSFEFFAPFWDTASPRVTESGAPTNAGATLGRVLFYDKRLSVTNTHSCSSCHRQQNNFASSERFDTGVLGVPLSRNSMSLANARFNLEMDYFIDQRVRTLETLVLQPIEEQKELGHPLPMLVEKLSATDFYEPLFAAAFGTSEVTSERIRDALSQFIRSLISYRSRYDQAFLPMNLSDPINPAAVLTAEEMAGREIFETFYTQPRSLPFTCKMCHQTDLQLMDTPVNNGLDVLSVDPGKAGRFRAASLRNIAFSGPYMHDGRFATLREVIDHYDHGIQDSPQLAAALRLDGTGTVQRLNLTESDKRALEAFLKTLSDTEILNDVRFSDPFR